MKPGIVYLIPSLLYETGIQAMPAYMLDAVKDCQSFFVENERTTRRYLKLFWKEMVIDDYEWIRIDESSAGIFRQRLLEGKNIGIISEAGCPGVADPGQSLVAIAHELNAQVRPYVGPSSILLALMGSGMNGQRFMFQGYLPIEQQERNRAIREMEKYSKENDCTQIFIETPYRNNVLVEAFLKICQPATRLCIAVDLTSPDEWILTKSIDKWKTSVPDIHKKPAIFLLYAG